MDELLEAVEDVRPSPSLSLTPNLTLLVPVSLNSRSGSGELIPPLCTSAPADTTSAASTTLKRNSSTACSNETSRFETSSYGLGGS